MRSRGKTHVNKRPYGDVKCYRYESSQETGVRGNTCIIYDDVGSKIGLVITYLMHCGYHGYLITAETVSCQSQAGGGLKIISRSLI